MAKAKPYTVFQTKEEFDKAFDRIFDTGYSRGHHDGRINALSYFVDVIGKEFETQEFDYAVDEARKRDIARWKREEESRKNLIEQVKKETLESINKG